MWRCAIRMMWPVYRTRAFIIIDSMLVESTRSKISRFVVQPWNMLPYGAKSQYVELFPMSYMLYKFYVSNPYSREEGTYVNRNSPVKLLSRQWDSIACSIKMHSHFLHVSEILGKNNASLWSVSIPKAKVATEKRNFRLWTRLKRTQRRIWCWSLKRSFWTILKSGCDARICVRRFKWPILKRAKLPLP